ncbi:MULTISPECIES: hypothetical protein [Xanthomonas]|uniref:DUF4189 domain-containing protein n=4 Tax=Xanthomonas TaxID=338 RepID=A0AB33CA45_XANCI|nr:MULTISPECIES: hypothetical protein [Xanthomonas]MBV6781530.1 hypothetical protein [Xanthomonas campestris pv. trichodesmae]MEE5090557.1 hypothetical protein [Xanthomonas euvesicatoria]AMV00414.1 hypothetical protein TP37_21700 [Xanthomonas citri pv. aurantifolii]AMV04730.1 hypothetical protein TP50_21495 [Xanthomonas citri pv. aurantifolii]ASK90423.1 hypothetical protein XcvCFBP7111P_01895 [Xanthomonas citri pv. vignicola]
MLLLAIVLAASVPAAPQLLVGQSFETFATQTDSLCPGRQARSITPGDLDFAQETFEAQLRPRTRTRLEAANTAATRCADRNGLSCQVEATLEALQQTRLLARFSRYVCSHPSPS